MPANSATDIRIPRVDPEIYNAIEEHQKNETRPYLHNMTLVLVKEALEARKKKQKEAA